MCSLRFHAHKYQIILAACTVNDPQEDVKINAIAREYDRLFILFTLNSIYYSSEFQEVSYSLNDRIKGVDVSEYRRVFDEIIIENIKDRKKLNDKPSLLDYSSFLKADYTNIQTRTLRYILARVEKFLCDGMHMNMANDVNYISTRTGAATGYHIEHILSHNDTNKSFFDSEEDFESKRNRLGGLLLLKGRQNISSGNEEYTDKLKTYSTSLVWGHTLCEDFYHVNKDLEAFNEWLFEQCGSRISSVSTFDKNALDQRCELIYKIIKIIWEVK